jgi:hypothetical protein
MLRGVLAVIAGVVAAVVVIMLAELGCSQLFPLPPGLDPTNREAIEAHVAKLPLIALLLVVLGWALGSIAGGWVAARISRTNATRSALIVGTLLLIAGVMNMMTIPHPLWMWIAGLAVYLPSAWLGARLAGAPRPAATARPAGSSA